MKPEATSMNARTIQYHLWIVIASFAFTLVFEFFTKRAFFSHLFVSIFILLLVQLELFIWLGQRMFSRLTYFTVKEFVNRILLQLLKFYLLVLLISFFLFVAIGLVSSLLNDHNPFEFIRSIPRNELKGFGIGSGIGLLCGSIFFFITQLIHAINQVQRLHEEKLAYQYQTLKNQVDPHFLFNSLNTLSSLVHTDAELADQFIQKLASTYRYILDHNQNNLVPVGDELDFVKAYFYLHQLRGKDKFRLEIDARIPADTQVLPVSLQLLVENALKHNAATREQPLFIRIEAGEPGYLTVSNNKQTMQALANPPIRA
ncbi:sensor histidine kinase [Gaoshiqia sp. Z1-71]|uniref:sensor histidine kinase n=1 Tax=Gaoshiqia hydrogeniformans TaxID=3290090 RepID=UPI003BF7A39B